MAEEKYTFNPVYSIEVDGKELPLETIAAISSVSFEEEINTASMFNVKFSTFEMESGDLKFIDLKDFQLGKEIKLSMGDDGYEEMITGEITSIETYFGNAPSYLEIRGYDRLHRLRFGKKRRTFLDVKDSDIASTIASDWGLSAETDDTGTVYPYIYQNNQSDLEFLMQRAKLIRYEVMVNGKTLKFRKAKEDEAESLELEYNVDFSEFRAQLSARYAGDEAIVQGWDMMNKEQIKAVAGPGKEISDMSADESGIDMTKSAFGSASSTYIGEYIVDAANAEEIAVAKYNSQLVMSVVGEGTCPGQPGLRAGATIKINGIERFSGIYYVTSTRHRMDSEGYLTYFKVRRTGL